MSAMEEDTELRDLLVQTLENSGVLNKIKAELRAAVFLALEEQEKIENKTPLVNESLKKFLNTKDGRLVSSLIMEFLQFFNLDFTLAVFQPETSTSNRPEDRENLANDLGIVETENTKTGPLLLEVIKRCHQKDKVFSNGDVPHDISDIVYSPRKLPEGKTSTQAAPSKIPRYKGLHTHTESMDKANEQVIESNNDTNLLPKEFKGRSNIQSLASKVKPESKITTTSATTWDARERSIVGQNDDDIEGDSFFDDSLHKLEKSFDWSTGKNSDTEEDADDQLIKTGGNPTGPERSYEPSKTGGLASLSNAPRLISGLSSLTGAPLVVDTEKNRSTVLKDLKAMTQNIGSLELGIGDEDDDYIDDFNSMSHRSDKSEISIGEEIEEISVEGEDFNASDKIDDITLDHTLSHASNVADYLEDVE
ncbi:centrosomal protein 43 isoform X2 [Microcaecilia unicolor]|uniref:Centrosomal protein 43 n=1 Tax=Microcaecilia unicolor TaxID=1415580 RepID=A0A6P7YP10_9AMPH|nr:FGFR1 oncogene partner isoform X2 [Microcaecilia unicolor]